MACLVNLTKEIDMLKLIAIGVGAFLGIYLTTIAVAMFQDPAKLGAEIPELRDMACIEYSHDYQPSQYLCMMPDQLAWYQAESDNLKARTNWDCDEGDDLYATICFNEDGTRMYSHR